jgi:hypothetical protein
MISMQMPDRSLDRMKRLLEGESGEGRALVANLEDNPVCTVRYDPTFRVSLCGGNTTPPADSFVTFMNA